MNQLDYQKDAQMYQFFSEKSKSYKPKVVTAAANPNQLDPAGIKFSTLISPDPSEKELKFLN